MANYFDSSTVKWGENFSNMVKDLKDRQEKDRQLKVAELHEKLLQDQLKEQKRQFNAQLSQAAATKQEVRQALIDNNKAVGTNADYGKAKINLHNELKEKKIENGLYSGSWFGNDIESDIKTNIGSLMSAFKNQIAKAKTITELESLKEEHTKLVDNEGVRKDFGDVDGNDPVYSNGEWAGGAYWTPFYELSGLIEQYKKNILSQNELRLNLIGLDSQKTKYGTNLREY